MKWLGLTGGIATGKSTVAELMREHGIPVICADKLSREAVQTGTAGLIQIAKEFGPDVLLPDGSLDRKALGKKVFGFPDRLLKLEAIVHPEVRRLQKEKREALLGSGEKIAVYDIPLLFEKKLQSDYDAVVVVGCLPETQLKRLMARDKISEAEALKRIGSQLPIAEKLKEADFVIMNNAGLSELKSEVDKVVAQIKSRFSI